MTNNKTFIGGVHPDDSKSLSMHHKITPLMCEEDAIYPLSQHIGAPAVSVVSIGQRVLVNELIAKANGFVSSNIHASISGTVSAIKEHRTANGSLATCIHITNDHLYESLPLTSKNDPSTLSKEEIINKIKEAGIVGMGGAGFPTHVKLSVKNPSEITHVLVNGAECEPYLTSDYRLMLERGEKLIEGLKIILSLFDHAKGYICIEDNKMECITHLQSLCKNENRIEVICLKTKYPQGGERFLIKAVCNKEINSSLLPANVGCIVNNVATVLAIHDAVIYDKPLTHRIVTVSGRGIVEANNYEVACGTSIDELIVASGGYKDKVEKIIAGGPMMGTALFTTDIPITKTSGGIIVLDHDEVSASSEMNCINCGRCLKACPSRLIPSHLAVYANRQNTTAFEKHYGMECIECGSCSFVCPSNRHLTQSIRYMRQHILLERKKAAALKGGN